MSANTPFAAAVPGVVITGTIGPRFDEILSPQALAFVADLHRRFDATRKRLLLSLIHI